MNTAKELQPEIEVIIVTGYATINSAVDVMAQGGALARWLSGSLSARMEMKTMLSTCLTGVAWHKTDGLLPEVCFRPGKQARY